MDKAWSERYVETAQSDDQEHMDKTRASAGVGAVSVTMKDLDFRTN